MLAGFIVVVGVGFRWYVEGIDEVVLKRQQSQVRLIVDDRYRAESFAIEVHAIWVFFAILVRALYRGDAILDLDGTVGLLVGRAGLVLP